jgi:hypothetical protein
VVITGDVTLDQAAGFWRQQWAHDMNAQSQYTDAKLNCYVRIAAHMSRVLGEATTLGSMADGARVLREPGGAEAPRGKGTVAPPPSAQTLAAFDQELLVAWLNFANGAYGFDEQVRTTGGIQLPWSPPAPTTPFWRVLSDAEGIRLNPTSTDAQVQAARSTLQQVGVLN